MLKQLDSGVEHYLSGQQLLGRGPLCCPRVEHSTVSTLHAELSWSGQAWQLRDLGSRNGTQIDGVRIESSACVELWPGAELTLGEACSFRLVDAQQPQLAASCAPDELRVAAEGLLCLPDDSEPQLTIYLAPTGDRWMLDKGNEAPQSIEPNQQLYAGDRLWTVHLPQVSAATSEIEAPLTLDVCVFEFTQSRDGEHTELAITFLGRRVDLTPRVHFELLLALARVRMSDAANADLPAREHGWVDRDLLSQQLGVDVALLNLWTHRARRQLGEFGFIDASSIVERRAGATQLRIGVDHLELTQS